MKRITLTRYVKEVDGWMLWEMYKNPNFAQFFRRIDPSLTMKQLTDFERIASGLLFVVLWDCIPVGFAHIGQTCPYGLVGQYSIMLETDYQDKVVDGFKIGFWACVEALKKCFCSAHLRKVTCKFLAFRKDIQEACIRAGFHLEGELKENCLFNGVYEDELEYAIMRDTFLNFISEKGI